MVTPSSPPLVACVDSSMDIVDLLEILVEDEGFRAATHVSSVEDGAPPVVEFLARVRPRVCIYAVSPPYQTNWETFERVRRAYPGCAYVLTTTNARMLKELVGSIDTPAVVGKPFDIDDILDAVRRALAAP